MTDIRISIEQMQEPDKSIGKALIEFYETMKSLEKDYHRGGKQATAVVMAMNDFNKIIEETKSEPIAWLCEKENRPAKVVDNSDVAIFYKDNGYTITELIKR